MAEWLKAHAWKACLGETLTRVRIPLSPPLLLLCLKAIQPFQIAFPFGVIGARHQEAFQNLPGLIEILVGGISLSLSAENLAALSKDPLALGLPEVLGAFLDLRLA